MEHITTTGEHSITQSVPTVTHAGVKFTDQGAASDQLHLNSTTTTTTTMETQIYQDNQAFVAACNANSVAPTTVTYESQEVQGALVRNDDGQVTIMLVCDQAAWENSEYKNRY